MQAKTSQLYTFQRSMQANRNINLWEAPVYRLSRSKAPKTQQICRYRHTRKTDELFPGVVFSFQNNFANSGSFAKVSVPVRIYNSLVLHTASVFHNWSCLLVLNIFVFLCILKKLTYLCNIVESLCSMSIME